MGFGPLVRGGIATAKSLVGGTDNLMDNVTIQYWKRDVDETGTAAYSSPVTYQAIVDRHQQMVKKSDGQEALAQTYVAFLEELPPYVDPFASTDRRQPLDERDIITLSDGTTGPTLSIQGLMDISASAPFLFEVYLG